MEMKGYALNESIQLHELITFKNICMTKSLTMSPLVSDEELKTILKNDVAASENHIKELKCLMEEAISNKCYK